MSKRTLAVLAVSVGCMAIAVGVAGFATRVSPGTVLEHFFYGTLGVCMGIYMASGTKD
jgi:hypothetical protein